MNNLLCFVVVHLGENANGLDNRLMADWAGGVGSGAQAGRTLVAEEVVATGYEGSGYFPIAADVTLTLAGQTFSGRGGVGWRRPGAEGPDAARGGRRFTDAFITV